MNATRILTSLVVVISLVAVAPAHADQASEGRAFLRPDVPGIGAATAVHELPAKRAPSSVSVTTVGAQTITGYSAPVVAQGPPSVPDPVGVPALCNIPQGPGGNCVSFLDPPKPDKPAKGEPPQQPSPQELARRLLDRAVALAPEPQLAVAPGRIGLTGLASYFWLKEEPRPIRATASVPGVTVTAEARPLEYVWDFDDGNQKVTTHSGRPWSRRGPGNISHLYETKAHYDLTVEVIWGARWRINDGPWQQLGYFSTSASRPYPVREVIAVLVSPHRQF